MGEIVAQWAGQEKHFLQLAREKEAPPAKPAHPVHPINPVVKTRSERQGSDRMNRIYRIRASMTSFLLRVSNHGGARLIGDCHGQPYFQQLTPGECLGLAGVEVREGVVGNRIESA